MGKLWEVRDKFLFTAPASQELKYFADGYSRAAHTGLAEANVSWSMGTRWLRRG